MRKKVWKKCFVMVLSGMLGISPAAAEAEKMEMVSGDRLEIPGIGISYELTGEMNEAGLKTGFSNYSLMSELGIFNVRMEKADLYYVLVYPEEVYLAESEADKWTTRFLNEYPALEYKEETNGDYHYTYLDLTQSLDSEKYEEADWEGIEQAIPLCEELIDSIEYMELEMNALTFDSVNLDGEQVTDAIFGEKKITVVNVWATYCNPCINEMPELAEWEKELGEDAQILYLCSDIVSEDASNLELAETIVEKSGINRKNVILSLPGTMEEVLMQVTGVPTTFFVDQNGRMMEDYVVGASVPRYKEILKKYLEEGSDE